MSRFFFGREPVWNRAHRPVDFQRDAPRSAISPVKFPAYLHCAVLLAALAGCRHESMRENRVDLVAALARFAQATSPAEQLTALHAVSPVDLRTANPEAAAIRATVLSLRDARWPRPANPPSHPTQCRPSYRRAGSGFGASPLPMARFGIAGSAVRAGAAGPTVGVARSGVAVARQGDGMYGLPTAADSPVTPFHLPGICQ